ncbi:hypothetical protein FVE85_8568 [Porphyridium purpureum]|uniref:Inner membrane protein YgaP-like transmembrane domain-containing protein n=1 Tax=Porphyridium purpureum TaxID=35688 RepID=A0A5J4YQR5_PORPP|nr:hypothetical protein FVE85_8568 [Porphyridium purpureum]|eukprot:POR5728..scf296_7
MKNLGDECGCRPGSDEELRVHDGIAGGLVAIGALAGIFIKPAFGWLAAGVGLLMVQSAITGFCPVHYALSKTKVGKSPAQKASMDGKDAVTKLSEDAKDFLGAK